ncbi:MAG TPA: hypothetical protein VEL75_14275 [Candidatus Methylomirabilis sp.]|nr:hypothetical protein [Candidatus Methylomirabilis sp.]
MVDMPPEIVELVVWGFSAFWLWLCLAALLKRLGLPRPQVGAAVLGWAGTGFALPWALPLVQHWLALCPELVHRLLSML